MEKKPTMEMTIRKGKQSQTVKLPCDFLTIKVALYQLDVLKGPEEVTVQDVNATFQSDDALGQKIVAMIQPTDSLSDVDVAVHQIRAAPKPVREGLSQLVLADAVENILYAGFLAMEETMADDKLYYRLGSMNLTGTGTEVELEQAEMYFQTAVELGNTDALYGLGKLYLNAEFPGYDPAKAVAYLEQAVAKGHAFAKYQLVSCCVRENW